MPALTTRKLCAANYSSSAESPCKPETLTTLIEIHNLINFPKVSGERLAFQSARTECLSGLGGGDLANNSGGVVGPRISLGGGKSDVNGTKMPKTTGAVATACLSLSRKTVGILQTEPIICA